MIKNLFPKQKIWQTPHVCIHEKSTLRFDSESAFNARKHWACDRYILTGKFGGATQI